MQGPRCAKGKGEECERGQGAIVRRGRSMGVRGSEEGKNFLFITRQWLLILAEQVSDEREPRVCDPHPSLVLKI